VTCVADPARPVDFPTDVVVVASQGFSCVQTGANANPSAFGPLVGFEITLPFNRCRERITRSMKHDKEGIALGVDFDSIVRCKRPSQNLAMRGEELSPASVTEAIREAGRAFNVGEQKCENPARQLFHRLESTRPPHA